MLLYSHYVADYAVLYPAAGVSSLHDAISEVVNYQEWAKIAFQGNMFLFRTPSSQPGDIVYFLARAWSDADVSPKPALLQHLLNTSYYRSITLQSCRDDLKHHGLSNDQIDRILIGSTAMAQENARRQREADLQVKLAQKAAKKANSSSCTIL